MSQLSPLKSIAEQLFSDLDAFEHNIDWGVVHYAHVSDHCARGRRLASHLRAVVSLADAEYFASSLVLVRTSLEHQLLSEVAMLCDVVEASGSMTAEQFCVLVTNFEAGSRPDIVETPTRSEDGHVTVMIRGAYDGSKSIADPENFTLPSAYFHIKNYEAQYAHPSRSPEMITGRPSRDGGVRRAKDNKNRYHTTVKWLQVLNSLERSRRMTPRQRTRMSQHYAYLSGFAHGTEAEAAVFERESIVPRPGPWRHVVSELVLLYVTCIAADAVQAMLEMVDRIVAVGLSGREALDGRIARSAELTAHMWWPRAAPTMFDRIEEANQRFFDSITDGGHTVEDPSAIPEEDVRYYADPLVRLSRLHSSFCEMTTGLGWTPAWDEHDE